jgi:hypothetical protein
MSSTVAKAARGARASTKSRISSPRQIRRPCRVALDAAAQRPVATYCGNRIVE